ncbi:MAG: hypothetical protein ABJF04_04375 [Reichenbachiella sp.]|uniref:hypothetical protein n=1 Tax=Reichenbachiella sp. TaxID=2184521 RepID=UPI0032668C0E
MKKFYFCLTLGLLFSSLAYSQLVFRHHYFQTDLSAFNTYRLAAFTINGVEADPSESSQISLVQGKLHEALAKRGFEQAVEPDMLLFLKLEIDTLGVALPNPEDREQIASFSVDIRQNPKYEKIFIGEVNGLIITNDKTDARLRKIYRRFFNSFER